MKLVSNDGAYLDLRPTAYQSEIPETSVVGGDVADLDDWLVINGHVRTSGHREWSFIQPCLTTREAIELADWLASVGAGRVEPSPAGSPDGRLAFIEPNIAFSVETVRTTRIRLRAHFSHESMPPWKPHHGWPDYQENFVALDVSAADVRAAAVEWAEETRALPDRTL